MKTNFEKVSAYYEKFDEWSRLDNFLGRVELERTLRAVQDHTSPGAKVLDLGGGPGRYTIELFKRGFHPTLIDLSPTLIEFAKSKIDEHGLRGQIAEPYVGSALDLNAVPEESFDAVLALGPFYHLVEEAERLQAMKEITRVLKPNGILLAAYIPRLSGVAGLFYRAAVNPHQVEPGTMTKTLTTGQFRNSSDTGFQEGIYLHPEEAEALFGSTGFSKLSHFSLKGLMVGREDHFRRTQEESPELYQEMMSIVEKTSSDPSVIQMSDHALVVLRK